MIALSALACLALIAPSLGQGVTIAHPTPLVAREAPGYAEGPSIAVAAAHAEHYAPVLGAVEKTQYHAQDELGQYAYGYSEPNQIKEERKFHDGTVIGSYSYNSPDGRVVTNNYVADDHGFRSNLAPTLHKDNTVAVAEEAAKVAALTDAYRAPIYADAYGAPALYQPAPSTVVERSYPHVPGHPTEQFHHARSAHVDLAPHAYVDGAVRVGHHGAPFHGPSPAPFHGPSPAPLHVTPAPYVEKTYVSATPAPYVEKAYVASPTPYSHVVHKAVHTEPAAPIHYEKHYETGSAHTSHKTYVKESPAHTYVKEEHHHHSASPAPYVSASPAPYVQKEYREDYVAVSPTPYAAHEHRTPAVHRVEKEYSAHTPHGPANIIRKEYHEPTVVAKSTKVDPYNGVAHEQAYIKPGVSIKKTVVDPLPRTVSVKNHLHSDPYHTSHHHERHVVDPAPQVHVEKTYTKPAVAHTEHYRGPYGDHHERTYVEPSVQVKKNYHHSGAPDHHVEVHESSHGHDHYAHAAYAARNYHEAERRSFHHGRRFGHPHPRFHRRGPVRHYRAFPRY